MRAISISRLIKKTPWVQAREERWWTGSKGTTRSQVNRVLSTTCSGTSPQLRTTRCVQVSLMLCCVQGKTKLLLRLPFNTILWKHVWGPEFNETTQLISGIATHGHAQKRHEKTRTLFIATVWARGRFFFYAHHNTKPVFSDLHTPELVLEKISVEKHSDSWLCPE